MSECDGLPTVCMDAVCICLPGWVVPAAGLPVWCRPSMSPARPRPLLRLPPLQVCRQRVPHG